MATELGKYAPADKGGEWGANGRTSRRCRRCLLMLSGDGGSRFWGETFRAVVRVGDFLQVKHLGQAGCITTVGV